SAEPTQVPANPLGVAITSPPGSASLNEMLVMTTLLEPGLVTVKVSEVVPLRGMLAAPKNLTRVGATGGGFTVSAATLLAAPGPLSLAEIGPGWLLNVPAVVG